MYTLGNTLFAVLFDLSAREVRGGPVPVIPEVQRSRAVEVGIAQYTLSDRGTAVYVRSGAAFDLALIDTVVLPISERTTGPLNASFSPDGRWVAYMAAAGGGEGFHTYISPFPFGAGVHRKVTNDPASQPVWSRNGRELFVFDNNSLRVLRMSTEPALTWTDPAAVFSTSAFVPFNFAGTNYDVSKDGQQFVAVVRAGTETGGERSTQEIQIVVNWFEELKRLVPAK